MFTLSIKWFDFNWKILIWLVIWCAASPSSVPTVWSLAGPKLSEVFLPLTHWDWPTLLSSQPHVPFSNEQPTNSEFVSLATRGGEKEQSVKLDFVDRKQKLLPDLYRCQAWQWCHRQRWSLCCWFLPQWVPGALRNRENDWEGFIPYSISISEQHSAYLKRSGGGYRLREPDPVAFTAVTVKHQLALRWSRTKIHPQHARVAVEEPTNVHQSIFFLLTTTF